MGAKEGMINGVLRVLYRTACSLDVQGLERIPLEGPGIIVSNHTSTFDAPLYYILLRQQDRDLTAIGKQELWDHPVTRFFMKSWNIIPIKRGRVDSEAIRKSMEALEKGSILGIAAEGTRSRTGQLRKGNPGVVLLAGEKKAPIYPMVHWGLVDLGKQLRTLSKTRVSIRVGRPFRLKELPGGHYGSHDRKQALREIMYQMALLLPPRLRGDYADLSALTTDYLEFLD